MTLPWIEGSQIIVPLVSSLPLSLRVTLKLTATCRPAAAAGVIVAEPITGLTTTTGGVYGAGGTGVVAVSVNTLSAGVGSAAL